MELPSGYVKIAIENGPVEIVDLPINSLEIFHSYVNVYQRVEKSTPIDWSHPAAPGHFTSRMNVFTSGRPGDGRFNGEFIGVSSGDLWIKNRFSWDVMIVGA